MIGLFLALRKELISFIRPGEKINKQGPRKATLHKEGLKEIPADCVPTEFEIGIISLRLRCVLPVFPHFNSTPHRSASRGERPNPLKMWSHKDS